MSIRAPGPGDDTSAQVAARTRADFRLLAERLARDLSGHVVRFRPGPSLTAMAEWLATPDDTRLVVVAGGHENADSMDEVLAYALAWQCDRDLLLVLPESREHQTLARLAWVDTPVRVFLHDSDGLRPAVIPSRSEVLAFAAGRGRRTIAEPDLGDMAPLVEWVTGWADDHWALAKVKRPVVPGVALRGPPGSQGRPVQRRYPDHRRGELLKEPARGRRNGPDSPCHP